ncbi:hypothetical protein ABW20_dc0110564 [Dactylellina cionopaga]|nr:hypothetical protein ABW20_dc0110564 [Dactylellina cionopaga]
MPIKAPIPYLLRLSGRSSICTRCLRRNPRYFSTSTRQREISLDPLTVDASAHSHFSSKRVLQLPKTVRELLLTTDDIPGQDTVVRGWVQSIRKMKNVCFATINDGSTTQAVQVVLTPDLAKGLTIGTAAKITGSWQGSLVKDAQRRELVAAEVGILGESDPASYPLQKKSHSFEYLRSIPHLRPKSNTFKSLLLLRSAAISHLTTFFTSASFLQTHPPILTSSDCEGAGEVFAVVSQHKDRRPFFTDPVYLTVSAQLHLEALALAASRVWCLSPAFRAEKSDTARHLNEFYMLEGEMAFVDDVTEVMDVVEGMITHLVNGITGDDGLKADLLGRRKSASEQGLLDSEALEKRWMAITDKPWAAITYTDAIRVLQQAAADGKKMFKFSVEWGMNLQSEHEKYIAEVVGDGAPVFVTDFPMQLKPFYMLPNSSTEDQEGGGRKTAACFDLLLPQVGEIVGGSLREHRYEALERAMEERGMSEDTKKQLGWYLELRKWGSVPHGGFGLGFDRLLAYLAGVENIRETVSFPRWYDRCLC